MEENQVSVQGGPDPSPEKKKNGVAEFFLNILRGAAIGVAFIIPGFSGGSVAAILGIYERLVGSIADIFKRFKKSVLFLLPIAIGMALGILALIIPIRWGLRNFPIPTVTLFVGLALGGLPSLTDKVKGRPKWYHFLALLIACGAAVGLIFLPVGRNVDLFALDAGGYVLLFFVGALGASALVVPGISGSMILLILGYYTPIVELVTENILRGMNIGTSALVLLCAFAGMLAGFFAVSVLMKFLLKKFPRGTHFAILGFLFGSLVTAYVTTVRNTPASLSYLYASPWYWIVSVLLFAVGVALSYLLVYFTKKRSSKK